MAVDNYTTVRKRSIEEFLKDALEVDYIEWIPIEHCSIDDLIKIADLAKKNDLVMTIKDEHSNFYQGTMVQLIKRKNIDDTFVKYI
nr:MAG TPA: hypothetical protein [Caudoviricetes sp.]